MSVPRVDLSSFEEPRDGEQAVVDAAGEYDALTQGPGWLRLLAAVQARMTLIGLKGHYDETARPGYYSGVLDGMGIVLDIPSEVIREAQKIVEHRKQENEAKKRPLSSELSAEELSLIRPIRSEEELL